MNKIKGLMPAALTPMAPNGDIMTDVIASQAAYFKKAGAAGVFVNGTTAEWASMTLGERKAITEAWVAQKEEGFTIISHVGHHCQREAIELAAHAAESGVDGISVVAPSYYQLTSPGDVLDWCGPIAAAAGKIPFYYYDLPQFTNIKVPAYDVIELMSRAMPTFAGLKYSSTDPAGLQRCVNLDGGRYTVFFGSDENLIMALSMGCEAGVGSTYNLALPHYLRIIEAFQAGDREKARTLQKLAVDWVDIMLRYGVVPSLKALQPLMGFEVGACRLPFRSLSEDDAQTLRADVTALGILDL